LIINLRHQGHERLKKPPPLSLADGRELLMAKDPRSESAFANAVLARLSPRVLETLRPHLEPVELPVKKPIYQPNERIRQVYFVELGMISVVSVMNDGGSIEVGTVGSEGMAGASVLLGADYLPYQCFVQLAGYGFSMKATALKEEAARSDELRESLLRYQSAFLIQSMQCTACNGLHSVAQRCCRWLLMSRDRAHSDVFPLTHEFLSLMLGVRRASVSDVLRPLQERGWIRSSRGAITIVDRAGLESGSCECYRLIRQQHA
jgi:CRP-like cAMP-binding protein